MHEESDTGEFRTRHRWQAALMVQYLVDLFEDWPDMQGDHGISRVYGGCNIRHPPQLSGCFLVDITGQLLQQGKQHALAQGQRNHRQDSPQINLPNEVCFSKNTQKM